VKLIRELRAENARLRALLGDAAVSDALFVAVLSPVTVVLYSASKLQHCVAIQICIIVIVIIITIIIIIIRQC